MDSIYSLSLFVSLLSGALSVLISAFSVRSFLAAHLPRFLHLATGTRRIAELAVVAAIASLFISLGIHVIWGHRPGTSNELGLFEFFKVHPSYLVAAAFPSCSALLLWLTGNH